MAADCRVPLEPCPFCGSEDIILSNWGMFRCWCSECKSKTEDCIYERDAIAAWNRRTQKNITHQSQ